MAHSKIEIQKFLTDSLKYPPATVIPWLNKLSVNDIPFFEADPTEFIRNYPITDEEKFARQERLQQQAEATIDLNVWP